MRGWKIATVVLASVMIFGLIAGAFFGGCYYAARTVEATDYECGYCHGYCTGYGVGCEYCANECRESYNEGYQDGYYEGLTK